MPSLLSHHQEVEVEVEEDEEVEVHEEGKEGEEGAEQEAKSNVSAASLEGPYNIFLNKTLSAERAP